MFNYAFLTVNKVSVVLTIGIRLVLSLDLEMIRVCTDSLADLI